MQYTPHTRPSRPLPSSWLASLVAGFALAFAPAAFAQRESFDASSESAPAKIVEHLSTAPARAVPRTGVDAHGAPKTVTATDIAIHFDNILFRLDSTAYKDVSSEKQVTQIAAALQSPKLKTKAFLIEGHTCDLGSEAHNLKLSAERAETVKKSLIQKGVSPERLATLGLGEAEPLKLSHAPASPAELETSRARNRRVVIRLLQTAEKSR